MLSGPVLTTLCPPASHRQRVVRNARSGGAENEHRAGPQTRAPADDRRRLRAAEGGVPRHLDLEDPLPRRRGPRDPAADPGRLPAVRRGRARPSRDDPPPPARRVSAAEGDPRGAREADIAGAPPPPCARATRRRCRARPGGALRASRHRPPPCSGARGVRSARATPCGRRALLQRERRRDRGDLRPPRKLRDCAAAPAHVPNVDGPRNGPARGGDCTRAALAQPRAAAAGDARLAGARRARAGPVATPLLAQSAPSRIRRRSSRRSASSRTGRLGASRT